MSEQSAGDLLGLVRALTQDAYTNSSKGLEQTVAALLDEHGGGDPYLRDLARLVRLHPHERQEVKRVRDAARHTMDLRSASQIVLPSKRGPLDPTIEDIAKRLANLIPDRGSDEPPTGIEAEVRQLGENAYARGGLQAMSDIWFRMEALGGHGGILSDLWHKVHTWRSFSARFDPPQQKA